VLKLRDGSRKSDKLYLLIRTYIKLTNKLVSSLFGAPLVLGQTTGNSGLTRLTTARIRGKPPPSPYSILCASPQHSHLNGFLSWDSQGGVSKLSRFRLPGLCEIITPCWDLQLGWGMKQTCSPLQELSNSVSHSTCTHQGWVDSQLLVVGSHIANLTPGLSFCHNLCYRHPNGPLESIFDIYTLIAFQWYKKHPNAKCFDPCNWTLKFQESRRTPKSSFRECEFHPHTLSK